MSRLAQLGVFSMVFGAVVLFLGLFPQAVDVDATPGIGFVQIVAILGGLLLLILGAFIVTRALVYTDGGRTLLSDIGIRLGLTGMVFAVAVTFADAMGYGSHEGGTVFGWLQTTGILLGFGMAALGVLVYGLGAGDSGAGSGAPQA